MGSIYRIAKSLLKRPWLILGTLCLVAAWYWEKQTITNYQNSVRRLERLNQEFQMATLQAKISKSNATIVTALRRHDSSSFTLYNLCEAYVDELLVLENANWGGDLIAKERHPGGSQIINAITTDRKFLNGMRDRQAVDSLLQMLNFTRREVAKKHISDQKEYNDRVISLKQDLDKNEYWQRWLYIIGVLLLAVDRGLKGLKDEEKEAETEKKYTETKGFLNKIIHNSNEIANKIKQKNQ